MVILAGIGVFFISQVREIAILWYNDIEQVIAFVVMSPIFGAMNRMMGCCSGLAFLT